jgi:3-phosphoshikimate 1-carboxyvinyltransferase
VTINAAPIPDLIPALAAVAAVSDWVTVIEQAGRLRLKESDRLAAIAQTLNALGAKVTEEEEGLRIEGVPRLIGGSVDAWGDHRIAMMAAIASAACENPVTIRGAEAVNKSYPSFWQVLSAMGKTVREEGEA